IRALDYCLKSQNLTMADIDMVAIPAAGSVTDLNFLLDLKGSKREPVSRKHQAAEFVNGILNTDGHKPPLYINQFPAHSRTEILHVEHHLAHAASAYYTSGTRDKQLIATVDGAGDGISVGLWRGENGRIERLQTFPTSASVGWFYSNVTEALGWWHGD